MSSAPRVLSILWLGASFIALQSCDGKRVRLGDATAGSGGMAGISSGGAGLVLSGGAGGTAGRGDGGSDRGGGASVAGSGTAGGAVGAAGAPESCERGLVNADEVVWIGDTWITIPGDQYTIVQDHAILTDALEEGEEYVILARGFQTMADIAEQYRTRQAGSTKVKVLVMDGGTFETIQGNASAASVASATDAFEQLLDDVAVDGTVEHVIYFLLPEVPGITGVKELRPGFLDACKASTVPCHFINLEDLWTRDEYSDGIQASALGATVIADAIWQVMGEHCIAQ
jgi:hypothetical protein